LNICNDFVAFWKLFCLIKKEKPDIIHTHTAKAGTLGRVAAFLARTPVCVHTFHGHVFHSYFGRIKTRIFIWIERLLANFTDRIIVVSDEVKKDLLNLRIANSDKLIVIKLGLEIDELLSVPIDSKPIANIGIVGRLVPVKNQKMFIDAACNVLSNIDFQISNLKFVLVGDGRLRSDLEEQTRRLKIEDRVVFTGWQKDSGKIYTDLDIVGLTSLNEGTPVSLIEAMASAKAVVATDVGGVRDLLGERLETKTYKGTSFYITERGVLVEPMDVEGFSSALRFLLQNPDIRLKMGKLSREFVRNRFHKSRLIQDMENLYTELVKEKL
jgi:glycosyltransferase involved in cell wall biosynthesis